MTLPIVEWPYLPTLVRLALSLAIGLFVGVERERRGKESGLRTFGFAALLGGIGGLLGDNYALLSLILLGVLIVFMNIQTLRSNQGTELTTSAALLVTGFAGVLCGQGHTLTPAAIAVIATALLALKQPLAGFSIGLSEVELRSAILLAILAIVIYPALPAGTIDLWGIIDLRTAWVTVILIAGIGFVNYVLWKIYGSHGIELTGFLGGLINSSVAVSELALRVRETDGQLADVAYRGMLLAMAAMIVRNAALLIILAPRAFVQVSMAFALMLAVSAGLALAHARRAPQLNIADTPALRLKSPFSLQSALKFGLLLLVIQVASVLAQHLAGALGVYAISFFGGLFSSASAVASAANLSTRGTITDSVAGAAAIIASLTSVAINLPLVMSGQNKRLTRRLVLATAVIAAVGVAGLLAQAAFWPALRLLI
ncbi:MAG: MgtC/SapB family protein [Anaerolineales bacterium]